MSIFEDVKLLIDVDSGESGLDDKIDLIIKHAKRQVLLRLPSDIEEVPPELEYIVCEVSVARFNRLGNEGMSSYSQEGESISFDDANDIDVYDSDIKEWIARREGKKRGVLRFI